MSPLLQRQTNSAFGMFSAATIGDFDSIATTSVGSGGTSTITFSSIPNKYNHLQIRFIAKDTKTDVNNGIPINIRFNSDTSTNYALHRLVGNGSAASSNGWASGTYSYVRAFNSCISGVANTFGAGVVDILDYANTNKYKTIRGLSGTETFSVGGATISSGLWLSTNAITSISLWSDSENLTQYSHFALYGIKAAI